MFVCFFQASDTTEDLKRKIQSQEGIPVDPQIISFGARKLPVKNRKILSRKCHQCKNTDNRSLGQFEEFRAVFGPSKKLVIKLDEESDEFHVSSRAHQSYIKSEGSKLSFVMIKTLTGKNFKLSVKVSQIQFD